MTTSCRTGAHLSVFRTLRLSKLFCSCNLLHHFIESIPPKFRPTRECAFEAFRIHAASLPVCNKSRRHTEAQPSLGIQ